MVANILPADPYPLTLGMGQKVKIQIIQNMVMLHIKLKGIMKCCNMVANILRADPPPTLGIGSVGQNSTFSEHDHVAYQNKKNQECSIMVANMLPTNPLPPPHRPWG